MKRKIYLFCAIALVISLQLHAQKRFFTSSLNKQEVTKVLETYKKPVKTTTAQAIETYSNEASVPVSFTYGTPSQKPYADGVEVKVEYDAAGRVVKISQDEKNFIDFIYHALGNGKWDTMEARSYKDGQLSENKQTVRTFDAQDRIIGISVKVYDLLNNAWNLVHEMAFDYNHTDNANDAVTTKDVKYLKRSNGTEYRKGYEYVWYEPKNKYYYGTFDENQDLSYKVDGNVLYNSVLTFDDEGKLYSQFHTKREFKQLDSETGFPLFHISESTDNESWTLNKITKESVNFNSSCFESAEDQVSECYTYNADGGLNNRVKYERIQQPSLKLVKVTTWTTKRHYITGSLAFSESEDRTVEYRPISESGIIGKFMKDFYLNDNGVFTFVDKVGEYEVFTNYSSDGKYMTKERISHSRKGERPFVMFEHYNPDNDSWIPSTNAKAGYGNNEKLRRIETNEDGFVLKDEIYTGVETQTHVLLANYTTYEYGDNSYTAEQHLKKYGDYDVKDILTTKEERKTLEDGTSELVSITYNEDESIESKIKYVYAVDNLSASYLTYHYDWDACTNDWKKDYSSITVDDDVYENYHGGYDTAHYKYQDGKIKLETITGVSYYGDTWTATKETTTEVYTEDGSYYPTTSIIENTYDIPVIDFIMPANPIPELTEISETFFDIYVPASMFGTETIKSVWDEGKQMLVEEEPGRRERTYSKNVYNDGTTHHFVCDGKYEFDFFVDSNNKLNRAIKHEERDGFMLYELEIYFTYDYRGRIQEVERRIDDLYTGEQHEIGCTFNYGNIVVDGISKPTVTTYDLSVFGRTITSKECKKLQLFTADGKIVGESLSGSIVAPNAGIYVVVADGVSRKVAIR